MDLDELCATHLGLKNENMNSATPTTTWHGPPSESMKKKTLLSEHLGAAEKNITYERSMSRIPQTLLTGTQFGEVSFEFFILPSYKSCYNIPIVAFSINIFCYTFLAETACQQNNKIAGTNQS